MSDRCEEWMGEQFSFPIMAARSFGQTPILKLKMMDTFFFNHPKTFNKELQSKN